MKTTLRAKAAHAIMAVLGLLLTTPALAGTFPNGAIGCLNEANLDQFMGAVAADDRRLSQSMIDAHECVIFSGHEYSMLERGVLVSKLRVYVPSGGSVDLYVPTGMAQ
jgi:hypothetical protein